MKHFEQAMENCALAGFVRNIAIHDHLSVYDSEVEPHAHLYNETTGEASDLNSTLLDELNIKVPDGYEISGLPGDRRPKFERRLIP